MTTRALRTLIVGSVVLPLVCAAAFSADHWTAAERAVLGELWLGALGPVPADPSNRYADDLRAAQFGHRLFFDASLSKNGRVSCASCHDPAREFQDGTPLAQGIGTTNRRTMPVAATAHAPFLFWDGRTDSQWAQALGPLENPDEHGTTRAAVAQVVATRYREVYEQIFGRMPELRSGGVDSATAVFVNAGKAIAAYERRIGFGPSRFDRYVEGLRSTGVAPSGVLAPDEVAGLRLFIGKANCTQCHNGPLFTNQEFHNTGVPAGTELPPDRGRAVGAREVRRAEFNCRSRWSDAPSEACVELEFLKDEGHELERAYKVPSLRNVAERAPYMHAGPIGTLAAVVNHYNRAPRAPSGHSELQPLRLSPRELQQLEAFLRTLSGGLSGPPEFLRPPGEVPE